MPAALGKFDFIVNRRSGAVLKAGEKTVRADILARFGDKAGTFAFVEGQDIAAAVSDWLAQASPSRSLVIGGGDGTVIAAAEQVLGHDDVTLGVLPLGTQNRIARRLGFSADFRTAAAQYKNTQSILMDVSEVNGMHFLVGIYLNQTSIDLNLARENLRNRKPFSAFRKAFTAIAGFLIKPQEDFLISKNGEKVKTFRGRFLGITNNKFKPRPIKEAPSEGGKLKNMLAQVCAKEKTSTGELSLYVLKGGLKSSEMLFRTLRNGIWTDSAMVQTESATQFLVQLSKGAAEKPILLDGELRNTKYPLNIRIMPKQLQLFKPV